MCTGSLLSAPRSGCPQATQCPPPGLPLCSPQAPGLWSRPKQGGDWQGHVDSALQTWSSDRQPPGLEVGGQQEAPNSTFIKAWGPRRAGWSMQLMLPSPFSLPIRAGQGSVSSPPTAPPRDAVPADRSRLCSGLCPFPQGPPCPGLPACVPQKHPKAVVSVASRPCPGLRHRTPEG